MRIVTNDELVARNKKYATRLFFFSIGVLLIGFFVANGQLFGLTDEEDLNSPIYLLAMPVVLVIGFISTMISVRMTNLWIRQPRPELAIQESLKGLSNKSGFYSYYHFPARHVLVTTQGVFAIITRFQDGKFSVENDRWRAHKGLIGSFFSFFRLDGIGNPTLEAREAAAYLRYIVEDYDPDLEIQPLIIFTDPRAKVEIGEITVPVLFADPKKDPSLKDYLKEYRQKNGDQFTPQELVEFVEEFEEASL